MSEEMKTLTLGATTYEIVDEVARASLNQKANVADLSRVAKTGAYNDLNGKPTIPSKITDLEDASDYAKASTVGDLTYLVTNRRENLVNAINEVSQRLESQDVSSVNGKTGNVVLTASDVGAASEAALTAESTARLEADTDLQSEIAAVRMAVGTPLTAATAAAMTDTTKIYVYVGSETGYTNGNWYYFDGSAWVSGGVYNSTAFQTDTTLTVSGAAADAKATGDTIARAPDATAATAGQSPIADGAGNWVWGDADIALYEQFGENFSYIRDFTELGAFAVTDIDSESDNPNRVRSKIFTITSLTQIKTIDPTDLLAVYAEDSNGTVTRVANNVNTATLTDLSMRYRYTGRTASGGAIPVSKIRSFSTRNDRNLNLNNRFRDAIALKVENGILNIVQSGSDIHAETSSDIIILSNDGYTRVTSGVGETSTVTLAQNCIVYAENGEIKAFSSRQDSPTSPKEAGKNRIFIGLIRSGEMYTWVSENILFNGSTPHIMGGNGSGTDKNENLMQIFPIYSVIGDSLACGFMNIEGVSVSSANAKAYGNNWPKYISLRIGRRFNNLAVGGATTTLWRNTHISTANVATSAYIIGLGVNDRRQQVTVGTPADIDANDYTQDAVSTYGNLDYIVNKLKEFNPYCHIFMLTIPAIEDTYNLATLGSCEQQNAAIRYVAGLYDNVHLIDLHNDSGYSSDLITDTFIANHFNPISYADMSTLIEEAINAYMAEHYDLFMTAPYHADGTCEQVSDGGGSAGVSSFNGQTGDVYYTAPVTSVNGQTGDVSLAIPTKTSDLINDSGYITSAPVTSVNGQTGAVSLTIPTKTSDLTNDSGFLTSAPVTSVNGQTGAVSLGIPTKTSDLTNDSGFLTSAPVASVNGQTGAVVIGNATTSSAGLMSATDKSNLDTLMSDYQSASTALG